MGQKPSRQPCYIGSSTGDQRVVCLRIPADGSFPELVSLPTVSNYDGNHDSYLFHLPNFRLYWGSEERWRFRTFGTMQVHKQDLPQLNGLYYMYKSFGMDDAPYNKHLRNFTRGDVFITKLVSDYGDGVGQAIFENVSPELLGSMLLNSMIQAMSIPGTLFWTINYDDRSFEYLNSNASSVSVKNRSEVVLVTTPSSHNIPLERESGSKNNTMKPLLSHIPQVHSPLVMLSS